jgi:hypothetical protein
LCTNLKRLDSAGIYLQLGGNKKMAKGKKRLTKEEIQERLEKRVAMAQQRDARVIQISSHRGNTMTNILRQFDKMYSILKDRIGEAGERGISFEDGAALMTEAEDAILIFSKVTEKIANALNFKYYIPDEIEEKSKAMEPETTRQ